MVTFTLPGSRLQNEHVAAITTALIETLISSGKSIQKPAVERRAPKKRRRSEWSGEPLYFAVAVVCRLLSVVCCLFLDPLDLLRNRSTKKLQIRGGFLAPQKPAVTRPRSPHKTPQLHHKNTTPNTPIWQKPSKNAQSTTRKKAGIVCPLSKRIWPRVEDPPAAKPFSINPLPTAATYRCGRQP